MPRLTLLVRTTKFNLGIQLPNPQLLHCTSFRCVRGHRRAGPGVDRQRPLQLGIILLTKPEAKGKNSADYRKCREGPDLSFQRVPLVLQTLGSHPRQGGVQEKSLPASSIRCMDCPPPDHRARTVPRFQTVPHRPVSPVHTSLRLSSLPRLAHTCELLPPNPFPFAPPSALSYF